MYIEDILRLGKISSYIGYNFSILDFENCLLEEVKRFNKFLGLKVIVVERV